MTIPVTTYQLAADLGALLLRKNFSITTAESCTGGGIAYVLTAVAQAALLIWTALLSLTAIKPSNSCWAVKSRNFVAIRCC